MSEAFVPRYYAIEQALRARIAQLEPDAPLPSDAQLCAEFGVSRMTARGSCVVSQVSFGRKNSPRFEVDGLLGALAWDGERNEELWLGRRDRGNEVLQRNAGLMHPAAAAHMHLPVAHAEGFADTFGELYRAVYADIGRGGPSDDPDYPTFRDGHVENLLGDAVALSNRERRWVEVPPR